MPELAIPLAGLAVVSIFAGGAIALRLAHTLPTVIALSGGIVVAVALLDVLPEAIDAVGDGREIGALVALGFIAFFLMERVLVLHHRDDPEEARAHGRVGSFGAIGLSLHSFTDGLGIGLAFSVSVETGLLVLLAVVSHGFADGLNTVSFVLSQSGDRRRALRWLRIDALAPLAGAIVGSLLSISEDSLGHFLAFYAGFFLYMGATDLLPTAHAHGHEDDGRSWLRVLLTLAGFAGIYAITLIGHPGA